uniref:Ras-related protein Rab-36 n=1 Tax=Clastoptera arizonana TaxID=38151 RepID=A0A1B6D7M2_9HEMI
MLESRSATYKMIRKDVPRDRQISIYPKPFKANSSPYLRNNFRKSVIDMCKMSYISCSLKICKAIFLGDMSVGKTSLVNRFCHEIFDHNYKSTIGVDFEIEKFDIMGVPFHLQIWDTAGQERFRSIASSYYRGADVIAVVFDLSNISSLYTVTQWLQDALKVNPKQPLLFLIGTKMDVISHSACVEMEKIALKMAAKLEAEYWAVSSKTGENVDEMFCRMAALVFDKLLMNERRSEHQMVTIGNINKPTSAECEGSQNNNNLKVKNSCGSCQY